MEQLTLTMAGQQALAGGARLRAGSSVVPACAVAAHGYAHLHTAKWTVDAIAEPTTATSMVFDGKNRHTRQPSELSP